ncbi:MAG: hypothetical protein GY898_08680 [Proteobacteria bacterium]|nr:hypothetical protein [Pseudomonadota bacterium]
MRRFLPLLILVLATGCATSRGGGAWSNGWWVQTIPIEGPDGANHTMVMRYRGADMADGWAPASAPPGDFAYYNERLGATVYADTSCGKRFDDAPLTVLSNHLTMGFQDVRIEEETTLTLGGRDGLERISSAALDGVPIGLASTVIKKGPCVFDLVLIAPPTAFEQSLRDYRDFRDGFDAEYDR